MACCICPTMASLGSCASMCRNQEDVGSEIDVMTFMNLTAGGQGQEGEAGLIPGGGHLLSHLEDHPGTGGPGLEPG